MHRHYVLVLLGCLLVAARNEADVIQTAPTGVINWTQRTMRVTGSGVPRSKLVNLSAVRLDAERAARAAAEVRLLDLVTALPLDANTTGATVLAQSAAAASKMPELLGNFRVVETRYFSDGGVDLVAEISADGAVAELLLRGRVDSTVSAFERLDDKTPGNTGGGFTGLVINGRGFKIPPVFSPTVIDDTGKTLYDAHNVSLVGLRTHGMVGYTHSLDAALRDARVGDRAKVARVLRVDGAGHLVIDHEESGDILGMDAALRDGRVIVVID